MKKSQIGVIPFIAYEANCFEPIIQHGYINGLVESITKTANISIKINFGWMVINKLCDHEQYLSKFRPYFRMNKIVEQ